MLRECMPDETVFESQITAYRSSLEELEQKAQSGYDKAVMTLSGGELPPEN
jgi:hypothetical protein